VNTQTSIEKLGHAEPISKRFQYVEFIVIIEIRSAFISQDISVMYNLTL
jgi:hypothetical protein